MINDLIKRYINSELVNEKSLVKFVIETSLKCSGEASSKIKAFKRYGESNLKLGKELCFVDFLKFYSIEQTKIKKTTQKKNNPTQAKSKKISKSNLSSKKKKTVSKSKDEKRAAYDLLRLNGKLNKRKGKRFELGKIKKVSYSSLSTKSSIRTLRG